MVRSCAYCRIKGSLCVCRTDRQGAYNLTIPKILFFAAVLASFVWAEAAALDMMLVSLIKNRSKHAHIMRSRFMVNSRSCTVGGNSYAIEASRACVDLAFNRYGLDKLYASIRPENAASVKLAEKLGMRKIGEYIKTYQGKEMPHDIYMLENTRNAPEPLV